MSDAARNIATVKGIYEAFGRGDIPAILEAMAEDVEWEFGTVDHGVPWLRPGRGRAAVKAFFAEIAGFDFRDFRVLSVMGEGQWVVGLIAVEFVVKATGKVVRDECEAHIWRFDAAGRITGMRHGVDTQAHLAAM